MSCPLDSMACFIACELQELDLFGQALLTVMPATKSASDDGRGYGRVQDCFPPRRVIVKPAIAATMPPMSIQTALSVGEPVKNRETSELNELVALMPMIIRTTPPTSRAIEAILFITGSFKNVFGCNGSGSRSGAPAAGDEVDEDHDDGNDQQDVDEPAHGGAGHHAQKPEYD